MTGKGPTAILADIGATNARFALLHGGTVSPVTSHAVADHATALDAMRAFLAGPGAGHHPTVAVLAAAGPVVNGRITMTNAAWVIDARQVRDSLAIPTVHVLNDFEVLGHALPALGPDDLCMIGDAPTASGGTMVVMGPGTGFGLAALARGTVGEIVLVTEGGHASLAAEDRREEALIRILRDKVPHVSVERVLSGPGLVSLYHAVAVVDGLVVRERTSPEIVAHALAGDCEGSVATLAAFCAFLGGVAGNAALTLGATGGVFIAGGIVPRFTAFLRASQFRQRFETKGRLASYLGRVPTAVVTHPNPAFAGLARLASSISGMDRRLAGN